MRKVLCLLVAVLSATLAEIVSTRTPLDVEGRLRDLEAKIAALTEDNKVLKNEIKKIVTNGTARLEAVEEAAEELKVENQALTWKVKYLWNATVNSFSGVKPRTRRFRGLVNGLGDTFKGFAKDLGSGDMPLPADVKSTLELIQGGMDRLQNELSGEGSGSGAGLDDETIAVMKNNIQVLEASNERIVAELGELTTIKTGLQRNQKRIQSNLAALQTFINNLDLNATLRDHDQRLAELSSNFGYGRTGPPTLQTTIGRPSAFSPNVHVNLRVPHHEEPSIVSPKEETITASEMEGIIFACNVSNLGRYQVAWLDLETSTIIAVGDDVLARDNRYSVSHTGDNWRLHISDLGTVDQGDYECQVTTKTPKRRVIHLIVRGKNEQ